MLEKMDAFFESRLDGYDQHMLANIESAEEFYPFTASALPVFPGLQLLDLGCGTGLELEYFFHLNPSAVVTGIDLSKGMLDHLSAKMPERNMTLIHGSYFDVPFGKSIYDAAVSVESLHHFTQKQKTALYQKLYGALKKGGFFLLTDYFSNTPEEEAAFFREFERLKAENNIIDQEFYHYDTPLTVKHETEALLQAGFNRVEELNHWGATHILKACK